MSWAGRGSQPVLAQSSTLWRIQLKLHGPKQYIFFVLYWTSLRLLVLSCSRVHSHVLQRAVWQVRHATAVWLLSILGPQLGVPEERHHGGNHELRRWHHQPAGEWWALSGWHRWFLHVFPRYSFNFELSSCFRGNGRNRCVCVCVFWNCLGRQSENRSRVLQPR